MDSELQAALPTALNNVLTTQARPAFQNFITAPVVTAVTNSSGGPITGSLSPQTILVTGTYVGAGPTIVVTTSTGGPYATVLIDDDVPVSGPFPVTLTFVSGTYLLAINNPSGLPSQMFSVTAS